MASSALTREEGWGLAISIAGHAALLALLVLRPSSGDVVTPPERVEVTISDDVALASTSPDPAPPSASVAPDVGDFLPPPAIAEALQFPMPEALERPMPPAVPAPRPRASPEPVPVPRPTASPRPRATSKPAPPAAAPKPRPQPAARASSSPAPRSQPKPVARSGGSRIGTDFLEGASSNSATGSSSSQAAETIGPRVQASLSAAISRALKPHWSPPQGADADQLVTYLAWNLNEDGSLSGSPRVIRQTGVNDANQAQAGRHAEQAVRAVQLAAPFNLPSQYYAGWKRVSSFRFDIRLSQ